MNTKEVLDQVYSAVNNNLEFFKKALEVQRTLVERTVEQFESAVKLVKK